MRSFVSVLLVGCVAGCAAPRSRGADAADSPTELRADATRYYTIWLGGARVGTAEESEQWSPLGVHLRRDETMRFLRGTAEVELLTTIDIDADPSLTARRVRWSERNGDHVRRADAMHDHDGWRVFELGDAKHGDISWRDDPSIHLAPAAVPAELVTLLVRRDGHFAGAVFLPARNFVGGVGRVDIVAPGRLVARLALGGGPLAEATIDLDREGAPVRVVDGEGVIAIRTTAALAHEPFTAVDLIAAMAVPIAGTRHVHHLVLEGDLALPPLPGQAAITSPIGVALELGAKLPGDLPNGDAGPDRAAEIRTLVAGVRDQIAPDLGASHGRARDDAAATAGDCTTFALAYAARATRRGIPTRVVTGLRVDGDRLVRHRWAVSWTGRAWIAVDAAYGAAPAGGDLIGLAVHDADDAGLVAGEAALAQVRAAAWN